MSDVGLLGLIVDKTGVTGVCVRSFKQLLLVFFVLDKFRQSYEDHLTSFYILYFIKCMILAVKECHPFLEELITRHGTMFSALI